MTKKFIWMISFLLTTLLTAIALLITSHLSNMQRPASYDSHPMLKIVSYAPNNTGHQFPVQLYVTPEDEVVKALAAQVNGAEDAYKLAVEWIYVSEQRLNHATEKWLTPDEFLANTPYYPNNPLIGETVSDCEEQANTLVSLIRAGGIAAEEVRVFLGKVNCADDATGHAWV